MFTITEDRKPRARTSRWIVLNEDGTYNPFVDACASLSEALAWLVMKTSQADRTILEWNSALPVYTEVRA